MESEFARRIDDAWSGSEPELVVRLIREAMEKGVNRMLLTKMVFNRIGFVFMTNTGTFEEQVAWVNALFGNGLDINVNVDGISPIEEAVKQSNYGIAFALLKYHPVLTPEVCQKLKNFVMFINQNCDYLNQVY